MHFYRKRMISCLNKMYTQGILCFIFEKIYEVTPFCKKIDSDIFKSGVLVILFTVNSFINVMHLLLKYCVHA